MVDWSTFIYIRPGLGNVGLGIRQIGQDLRQFGPVNLVLGMLVQELDRLVWALTLIVLGEVKIYLAKFDVKWQKNFKFTFEPPTAKPLAKLIKL